MRPATPIMRRYATALLALETKLNKSAGKEKPVALEICERLRPHLAVLMGTYGFYAILSRAHLLATVQVPWLLTLRPLEAGGWEVPQQLETKITAEQLAEGNVVMLAHLLGLLTALMGEEVTIGQIHVIWSRRRLDQGGNGHEPIS